MSTFRYWWVGGVVLAAGVSACQDSTSTATGPALVQLTDSRALVPDGEILDLRDAVPGPDGGVWTLSTYEPFISLVSVTGEVTSSFGFRGDGPDELRNPWYLTEHPDGIAVLDVGARRLKVYSSEGNLLESVTAPSPGAAVLNDYRDWEFGEPQRVHRVRGGWMFETYGEGQVRHSGDLWLGRLHGLRDGESEFNLLLDFDSLRSDIDLPGPLFPLAPLWSRCGEGVVVLIPTSGTLLRVTLDGIVHREQIDLQLPRFDDASLDLLVDRVIDRELGPLGPAVEGDEREALRRDIREGVRALVPELEPPTKILCDPQDRVWMAGFGLEVDQRGYGRTWQVFDAGEQIGSVEFPERVVPLYVEQDRAVARWRDALDVEHLVEVPLNGVRF
ncbi:MAG: hypothetical protein WD960_00525 [Gemmatimonadota bacterium]